MSDSEIPLLTQLRAEFYAAAKVDAASHSRKPRRGWDPRRRSGFAAVALALVIAGCAVAAASGLFSSSERLALSKVDCYFSDEVHLPGVPGFDPIVTGALLTAGQTPAQLCQEQFRASASAYRSEGVRSPGTAQVLTCRQSATRTAVFVGSGLAIVGRRAALIGSGTADPCRQLGLAPLPGNFAAASASVRDLADQLEKRYVSRNCWAPKDFARVARTVLAQNGFTRWRVRLPPKITFPSNEPPPGVGQCAQFSAPDPSALSSDQSLNGVNRTLTLGLTIPRSLNTLISREDSILSADLWQHCYSPTAVTTLIDHAFASTGMTVKIAVTTNPNGGKGFSWGTKAEARHYAADCPILVDAWPTLDDRIMLVWLNAHNGTYIKPFLPGPPALADFHTS